MTHEYSRDEVSISLKEIGELCIYAENQGRDTLLEFPKNESYIHGEESIQLLEGSYYEYELPKGYELRDSSGNLVRPSKIKSRKHTGRIEPNIYVGRLALTITKDNQFIDEVAVEVRSIKANYRSEYRKMLEDITEECTELLMIHSSPVTQRFTIDYEGESETLYQRFSFVKSIVDSDEFRNAVHRVISMPVTAWTHRIEEHDIRRSRRISSSQLRQMASRSDRIQLPANHSLRGRMASVPSRLTAETKIDTVDTPENRFVKHALKEFERFCGLVCRHIEENKSKAKFPAIYHEAKELEERFAEYLSHTMFREVSVPTSLPLNSPVLQRKEGYREILRVWLMFDLAAKLTWNVLDEQYQAGKRDVATLYEYWLFFKLLRLVQEIFSVQPKETAQLIQATSDGLGLQLKSGKFIPIIGEYTHKGRRLKVQFSYNRTFGRSNYPKGGSWTKQMRPDYTLSLWPTDFKAEEAEKQELIVHIHFDAKYKVQGLKYLTSNESSSEEDSPENLNTEKQEQKEGTYKRADLLKMHAYKDAIRRTAGAYILYPGATEYRQKGFHEIIPGLGAFPISPSNNGEGVEQLRSFIQEIIDHFADRASRREEVSYHTFQANRANQKRDSFYDEFPEKQDGFRALPPQKKRF
jgi:predicted component of viral defense system (DUF524 family)